MRRAVAALGASLMGASALIAGAPPAAAGIGGDDFQVVSRTWSERYEDRGPKGEGAGDVFYFTEKLFHHGERAGRDAGRCDITRASQHAFSLHCVVTVTFRGRGDLTVQGQITYRRGGPQDTTLAVTGGTGQYRGASGVVELVDRRDRATRLRFHLD